MQLHRFRPNTRRARVAQAALALWAAALLAHGTLYGSRLALGSEAAAATAATTLVGYAARLGLLGAAIAFIAWFHRAYHDERALGGRARHGTGWAIACWLVPLLQLYRPMQLAREMWLGAGSEHTGSHRIVACWWGAALLGAFFAGASRTWPHLPDARQAVASAGFGIAADAAWLVGTLLAMRMVRRLTAAHEAVHAQRAATSVDAGIAVAG